MLEEALPLAMDNLLEKVRQTVLRYRLIEDGHQVVVAVSGGADSLALLYLLDRLRREGTPRFILQVAHLHHGLRGPAAREDALFVRREAEKLGLPFYCGKADTPHFQKKWGFSREDAARRLRYRYLSQVAERTGASQIAVGHHRDDQVETVLLNVLRGTGPHGLAGMKIKRELQPGKGIPYLIRPLLHVAKGEIEQYCRAMKLSPRLDESNLQLDYRRNRVRLDLIPYLEREFNPSFRLSIVQLSRLIEADQEYLEKCAEERLSGLLLREEHDRIELDARCLTGEHAAIQGRVIRLALRRLRGNIGDTGFAHVRSILELCRRNPSYGSTDLPGSVKAEISYGALRIILGGSRGKSGVVPVELKVPGEALISEKGWKLRAEVLAPDELPWPPDCGREAYLDFDKVVQAVEGEKNKDGENNEQGWEPVLRVRSRQEGERFRPLGAPGHKKMKDFFIDRKIPLPERREIPVVSAGNEAIWVCGVQISHGFRVTENTKRVLRLSLLKVPVAER